MLRKPVFSWYPASMRKAELESGIGGIRSFGHRRGRWDLKGPIVLTVGALAQCARPYAAEDVSVQLARPSARAEA